MLIDEHEFVVDVAAKFYSAIRISGWFHHRDDPLAEVVLVADDILAARSAVGTPGSGVEATLGQDKGFWLQALLKRERIEGLQVRFKARSGWTCEVGVDELIADRLKRFPSVALDRRFRDAVAAIEGCRVLDIGGRDRSQIDLSATFEGSNVTVLDILPGANVDVVGDAHRIGSLFPPEYFDAVYSAAVFEHLLMPWSVVTQLSRVLKTGGLVLVGTHQTLGLHDPPWDYWRFSDMAWDALFNKHTGFEIVERAMDHEEYVIPFLCRPGKEDAERSVGFEASAVLARKIGQCGLSWDVAVADIVRTSYPTD
ncbi:MAG: methyltransferase domain-containing protein [Isosphaeraceae bacterium]|nr:methyltransferase domain-containing protein [Isosphaeraceae bacterium]